VLGSSIYSWLTEKGCLTGLVFCFYIAVGARWSNIAEAVSSTDELSVGYGCLMLILDTLLYTLLTIYFENVIPSEFGIRKPWYYPFQVTHPPAQSFIFPAINPMFQTQIQGVNMGAGVQASCLFCRKSK